MCLGHVRYCIYIIPFNLHSQEPPNLFPCFSCPSPILSLYSSWRVFWNYIRSLTPLLKTVKPYLTSSHTKPSFPHCTWTPLTTFHFSARQHGLPLNVLTSSTFGLEHLVLYLHTASSTFLLNLPVFLLDHPKKGTPPSLSILPPCCFSVHFTIWNYLVQIFIWFLPFVCKSQDSKDLVCSIHHYIFPQCLVHTRCSTCWRIL